MLQMTVSVGTLQLTLSIGIMHIPSSAAIMQAFKFYCNYVSGTFLYDYVGRDFWCIYTGKSFYSKYVGDNYFWNYVRIVSVAIMQVVFSAVHYKKKKNIMAPFLRMGFNCLKARATSRRQFTFYHYVPRSFWYSFYQPWKDERLSRPCNHPVNLGATHYALEYLYCNYAGDCFCCSYVCDSFM